MSSGSYVEEEFQRDTRYITTRITADGTPDGYAVEPGRYRLVVARACPWAHRTIDRASAAGPGGRHLDGHLRACARRTTAGPSTWIPASVDPVLGIPRLKDAYERPARRLPTRA